MNALRRWTRGHGWDLVIVSIVLLAFAIPLRGLMRFQGPPMEEGFMLAFPQEVLRGSIPNKDFLHLYGPGSLWALAGTYWVFGTSLATERLFGLGQHLVFVFGVLAVARRWGRVIGLVCALTSLLIVVPPAGLTALAWNGGLALSIWAVWFATRRVPSSLARPVTSAELEGADARPEPIDDPPAVRRGLFVAGLLGGFALLFRPDLIVALTLGLGAAVWPFAWRRWRPLVLGSLVGVSPVLVHFATAGLGNSIEGMLLDPVVKLRPGRTLPVPPSWDELDGWFQKASGLRTLGWPFPAPELSHQVAMWFWLVVGSALFVAAVGIFAVRRAPEDRRARTLRAVGFLGLGMLSQALQRPDTTHLAWVSCVPLALVPAAITELLRHRRDPVPRRVRLPLAVAPALVVLLAVIPHFTVRSWIDLSQQSFGRNVFGYPVNNEGRNFYLGSPEVAAAANALVADLQAEAVDGERLFVGPMDLRRTPYSDASFYFLFPQLVPATYFIEMDPGIADAEGSRLADDVASADWLILSNVWTTWTEPNESDRVGPDAPNEVVRQQFCPVGTYGTTPAGEPWFSLHRRCP